MRRAITATFLSGWIGFHAVAASIPTFAVLRTAEPGFPVPPVLLAPIDRLSFAILAAGNGELLLATGTALAAAMISATLALSLWLSQRGAVDDRRFGERFAFGGLAATAALAATVQSAGSPALDAAGSLPAFLVIVGLTSAAILFDRMLDADEGETEADDAGFRAALSLIGQEMARDISRAATGNDRDPPAGRP